MGNEYRRNTRRKKHSNFSLPTFLAARYLFTAEYCSSRRSMSLVIQCGLILLYPTLHVYYIQYTSNKLIKNKGINADTSYVHN